MYKLVCVTGLPGSGKSTLSDYFFKKGFVFFRFGQITLDTLLKKGIPVNEKNEKKLREDLRKKYGMAAYAILAYPKIKNMLSKNDVIADGLYSFEEYKYLKRRFKKQMIVIATFSPPQIRYKRLIRRRNPKGDKLKRFRPLSFKEAQSRDYAEIENLHIGGTIAIADYTLVNIKSKSSFIYQVKRLYEKITITSL